MEQGSAGMGSMATVDRTRALYARPVLGIEDEATFHEVRSTVERCFSTSEVERFLKSLDRGGLRIRDFAAVLHAGKLGPSTAAAYARLSGGDQGQIREFYLAALEQVALPLRDKFFKLYAYY